MSVFQDFAPTMREHYLRRDVYQSSILKTTPLDERLFELLLADVRDVQGSVARDLLNDVSRWQWFGAWLEVCHGVPRAWCYELLRHAYRYYLVGQARYDDPRRMLSICGIHAYLGEWREWRARSMEPSARVWAVPRTRRLHQLLHPHTPYCFPDVDNSW